MSENGKKRYTQEGTHSPNSPPKRPDVNASQRAALAIKLRASKLTYDEIAVKLGFVDRSHARRAIQKELDRCVVTNAEELRREEGYMLDQMHIEIWQLFMDKSNTWRLHAADRLIAIAERRAKLFNLDIKPDEQVGPQIIIEEVALNYLEGPKEIQS